METSTSRYVDRHYRDIEHGNIAQVMYACRYLDHERRFNVKHYNEIIAKISNEKIDLNNYYNYLEKAWN